MDTVTRETVEIGGFFEYPDHFPSPGKKSVFSYLTDSPSLPKDRKTVFVRDGRQAIYSVLQHNQRLLKNSNCYLPAYICKSMIQPFSDIKMKVRFYGHTAPLKPVIDYGLKNSLFLINDLFGVHGLSEKEILELDRNGNFIILDISHSVFDPSRIKFSAKHLYTIASLRKVFPICDGGIVYSSDPSFNPELSNPAGWEPILEAMILKRNYPNNKKVQNSHRIKTHYRRLYEDYSKKKDLPLNKTEKIPEVSITTLKNLNFLEIRKRRQTNLEHIYSYLAKKNQLFHLRSIRSPFVAPVLFKDNKRRNDCRNQLIARNLFPPLHWDIPRDVPQAFAYEHNISGRLLSIPIDQRYNPDSYGDTCKLFLKNQNPR